MTRNEAIQAYIDKFGGFPYFLMMGASDEHVIEQVQKSLKSGQEIKSNDNNIY